MSLNFNSVNITRTAADINLASPGDRDLLLKVFSGTVLEAFRTKTVFYSNDPPIIATKEISSGSSVQWPIMGDDILVSAQTAANQGLAKGYHNPGDYIKGSQVPLSETIISVDDILAVAMDVPHIDLDLTHFDVLGPFATKMGRSMAIDNDIKIATMAIKAARTGVFPAPGANEGVIHKGGHHLVRGWNANPVTPQLVYPDDDAGAKRFRRDVAALAEDMDKRFVPEQGRYLFIPPYIRRILRNELEIFNRDFNSRSVGDLNVRSLGILEGFNLVLTTSIPQATITGYQNAGVTNRHAKYNLTIDHNNANVAIARQNALPVAIALCGASEGVAAVGKVSVKGIQTVMEDDHRRNIKFLKSQMLVGYGILAPWCAGSIAIARDAGATPTSDGGFFPGAV